MRPLRCQLIEPVRGMAETSQPTHDGQGVGKETCTKQNATAFRGGGGPWNPESPVWSSLRDRELLVPHNFNVRPRT